MIRAALLPLAMLAVAIPGYAQEETIGIPVGASAPAPIAVQDLDGQPLDLAAVIGPGPTVIEFWATWCPLCEALLPQLETAKARYGADIEIVFVAVGVGQSRTSVRRHLERHALPGRVVWDANGAATRAFQAPSTSYVVGLDAEGVVRYTGLGDRQKIDVAVAKAAGGNRQ